MTAREKLLAAFEPEGTSETGAVVCYDGILVRDHYAAITSVPWWDFTPEAMKQKARDYYERTGLEWMATYACESRENRRRTRIEVRPDGVWRLDITTGEAQRLPEPMVSGTNTACARSHHLPPESWPTRPDQFDALIPLSPPFDRNRFLQEGRQDVAWAIRETGLFTYGAVNSPIWSLYGLLGYEGMMMLLAEQPDLALYAARRILENTRPFIAQIAALGGDAVWIEECLTDQFSPQTFRQINLPLLRSLTETIRSFGLKSIYYYCGNPWNRLDAILDVGADALHFEESKKGFAIPIEALAEAVAGRCTLFGNLDAISVLQDGTEEKLRSEITRQLRAGRKNRGRFIMSTGSPVTPGTPIARVRLYTNLVRELSKKI